MSSKPEMRCSGISFQCRRKGKRSDDVYASGGRCVPLFPSPLVYTHGNANRYDELLQSMASATTRKLRRSLVGVTVAVSKLGKAVQRSSIAIKHAHLNAESFRSRCIAYIVSYSPDLIEERLLVARLCWRGGIRADLVLSAFRRYNSLTNADEIWSQMYEGQQAYCCSRHHTTDRHDVTRRLCKNDTRSHRRYPRPRGRAILDCREGFPSVQRSQ